MKRLAPSVLLVALTTVACAIAVAPFTPLRVLYRRGTDGATLRYWVDGARTEAAHASYPAGVTIVFTTPRRPGGAPPLDLRGRISLQNETGGKPAGAVRIWIGETLAAEATAVDGNVSFAVPADRFPNGPVRIRVETPDGTTVARLHLQNAAVLHTGGARFGLGRSPEPLSARAGATLDALRETQPWMVGAAVAAFLALRALLLARLARRGWIAPPAAFRMGALLPAGVVAGLLAALPLLGPWRIALSPTAFGLTLFWALLLPAAVDLLKRRAARVETDADPDVRERFRRRRTALFLFAGSLAVYMVNFASQDAVDAIPCPYAALSLVREGDFDLEEFPALRPFTNRIEFVDSAVIDTGAHWVSKYPPGGAILTAPLFFVLDRIGLLDPREKRNMLFHGKTAAAFYTALSVPAVYLALLVLARRAPMLFPLAPSHAALLSAVYAFGTGAWSTSSQSAWQHGFAQCFVAWGAWRLLAGTQAGGARFALGALLGTAVLARPTNAILAAAVATFLARRHLPRMPLVLAGAAAPAAALAAYNAFYFGSLSATGYGPELVRFQTPLAEGVLGLLASPNRGLFVFSPVLLFALPGVLFTWRPADSTTVRGVEAEPRAALRAMSLAALGTLVLFAKWNAWDGGWCYGCRMLADILPLLALFAGAGVAGLWRAPTARRLFWIAAALSVAIHALGVIFHTNDWNADPTSTPWRLDRTQIGSHLRHAIETLSGERRPL